MSIERDSRGQRQWFDEPVTPPPMTTGILDALERAAKLVDEAHPNWPQPDAALLRELRERLEAWTNDIDVTATEAEQRLLDWLGENLR